MREGRGVAEWQPPVTRLDEDTNSVNFKSLDSKSEARIPRSSAKQDDRAKDWKEILACLKIYGDISTEPPVVRKPPTIHSNLRDRLYLATLLCTNRQLYAQT